MVGKRADPRTVAGDLGIVVAAAVYSFAGAVVLTSRDRAHCIVGVVATAVAVADFVVVAAGIVAAVVGIVVVDRH